MRLRIVAAASLLALPVLPASGQSPLNVVATIGMIGDIAQTDPERN